MTNGNELDNWDDFISGNFLKAINVDGDNDAFVCTKIEIANEKDGQRLRASVEKNKQEYLFDINKTNSIKLKELGLKNPKEIVGKKIYFRKALVRNPKTNQEVEGLRIHKVE